MNTNNIISRIFTGDYVCVAHFMATNVPTCGNQAPEDKEWDTYDIREDGEDILSCFVVDKNWYSANGTSQYAKDFNPALKNKIRRRDAFTCCMCKDREILSSFHVHHIDYDKRNSSPYNLITLCASCHGRTHKNRTRWMNYFEDKLEDKEMSV